MSRRQEFAKLLPLVIRRARDGDAVHLSDIYGAVERDRGPHWGRSRTKNDP